MKIRSAEPQQWGTALAGCPKTENRNPEVEGVDDMEWWTRLPGGERALIRAVVWMLRSARRSRNREVAWAAAKWERSIGCFIKVRLMGEKQRAESRKPKAEMEA